ncbi:hypothetical protein BC829DRAFT_120442 [Chytridium lagenaria]|nr:hypothetical protein BC829DRAFT_120442 [Chytridium lagenaria]
MLLKEFGAGASQLIDVSSSVGDTWFMLDGVDRIVCKRVEVVSLLDVSKFVLINDDDDPHSISTNGSIHIWEFHVIYSKTWACPILLFNAFDASGSPVDITSTAKLSDEVPFSMMNHPKHDTPFYFIHPCNTASLSQDLLLDFTDKLYLTRWLVLISSSILTANIPNPLHPLNGWRKLVSLKADPI